MPSSAETRDLSRRELRQQLTRLFPDIADIKRVLDDVGVDHTCIDMNGAVQNVWFQAIEEVERHGPEKVRDFLRVVQESYPGDRGLQTAAQQYAAVSIQLSLGATVAILLSVIAVAAITLIALLTIVRISRNCRAMDDGSGTQSCNPFGRMCDECVPLQRSQPAPPASSVQPNPVVPAPAPTPPEVAVGQSRNGASSTTRTQSGGRSRERHQGDGRGCYRYAKQGRFQWGPSCPDGSVSGGVVTPEEATGIPSECGGIYHECH